MQTNWILLVALVTCCAARSAKHHSSHSAPNEASQTIPNYWKMEINNTLGVTREEVLGAKVVIHHGRNYVELHDGRRILIKLEPIGNNGMFDGTINKDFDIRLNLPLNFMYAVYGQGHTGDGAVIAENIEVFRINPSQSFVYTSKTKHFSSLPLWKIDYSAEVLTGFNDRNVYWMQFSIHKVCS